MNLDSLKAMNDAATSSAKDQISLGQQSLQNKLDIGGQIVLQQAADVVTRIAKEQALNPQ